MLTKTAIKVAKMYSTDKKLPLEVRSALVALSSAVLKQKLVINQYAKREANWNKMTDFLKKI